MLKLLNNHYIQNDSDIAIIIREYINFIIISFINESYYYKNNIFSYGNNMKNFYSINRKLLDN